MPETTHSSLELFISQDAEKQLASLAEYLRKTAITKLFRITHDSIQRRKRIQQWKRESFAMRFRIDKNHRMILLKINPHQLCVIHAGTHNESDRFINNTSNPLSTCENRSPIKDSDVIIPYINKPTTLPISSEDIMVSTPIQLTELNSAAENFAAVIHNIFETQINGLTELVEENRTQIDNLSHQLDDIQVELKSMNSLRQQFITLDERLIASIADITRQVGELMASHDGLDAKVNELINQHGEDSRTVAKALTRIEALESKSEIATALAKKIDQCESKLEDHATQLAEATALGTKIDECEAKLSDHTQKLQTLQKESVEAIAELKREVGPERISSLMQQLENLAALTATLQNDYELQHQSSLKLEQLHSNLQRHTSDLESQLQKSRFNHDQELKELSEANREITRQLMMNNSLLDTIFEELAQLKQRQSDYEEVDNRGVIRCCLDYCKKCFNALIMVFRKRAM